MAGGYELALWALLVCASVTDLLWKKIPNRLTFSFLAAGLLCRFCLEGRHGGQEALLSLAVAFALFFPLWLLNAFKAGDVKLLMAAAPWIPVKTTILLALAAIVVGAIVGIVVLLRHHGVRGSLLSLRNHLRSRSTPTSSVRMPFAPAFLCAFCFVRIAEIYRWNLF
jgi:prepilin peptidase CpaA